jgi:hypothetical protein
MSRLRSRQLKLDGAVPTKISDMKDGEVRVTVGGIYSRVGNQVLFESWDAVYLTTSTTTTTTTST